MTGDEITRNPAFMKKYPDRLQQILNRLQKQFERLNYEDRRLRLCQEIEKMNISERDRLELLRRIN